MADEGANRHAAGREYRRINVTKRRISTDVLRINIEKDVRATVLEDILPNLVSQHGIPTSNVIASCNVICTLSKRILQEAPDLLESIFRCFLPCLLHNVKEVRISALRAIRYLVRCSSHFQIFLQLHLDYLVARALDLSSEERRPLGLHHLGQNEGVHALRLVSHLLHVDPHVMPRTLVRPLVALAKEMRDTGPNTPGAGGGSNADEGETESAARGCLLVLTELALLNPDLVNTCGGFSVLLEAVLNPYLASCPRIPESVLLALLHLLNFPKTRRHFLKCQYLEHLLSPLSNPSMYQLSVKNRKGSHETHLSEIRLACSALLSTFRSWSGLLYLCQPQSSGIKTLTDVLVVGPLPLQHYLLDLFFSLFHLRRPADDNLHSFDAALTSVDPQTWRPSWALGEGFVAKEGLSLLSYKSVSKMNLVDNHLSLLISVFFNHGLVQGLCRLLVQSSNEELSVKAGILLAELMHLSSVLLAPDHPVSQTANQALSLLLSHEQSRRVLHWLEQVHWVKEQPPKPCSPFLFYIVASASTPQAPSFTALPVGGAVLTSGPRNNSMASLASPPMTAPPTAAAPRLTLRHTNSNSIGSSSGWLGTDQAADGERPRHGSLTSSCAKFVESLIDKAVAESGVLPPPHHGRPSGPAGPASGPFSTLGIDYTNPDLWDWDLLLCTARRLLDSVCPSCQPHNGSQHSHHPSYHPHYFVTPATGFGSGVIGGSGAPAGSGPSGGVVPPSTARLPSWDDPSRARFLRRLMGFFSLPSEPRGTSPAASFSAAHAVLHRQASGSHTPGFFANRPATWRPGRQAAAFATDLFAFLAVYPAESEPGQLLEDFLRDFAVALRAATPAAGEELGSLAHDAPLAPGPLERSCSHFLFLPICRLTWSDRGEQLLEVHGVTEALVQLLTFTRCPLYVKLVISSLDYSRQGSLSRLLLDRATTATCDEARVFVAQFLRVLLRANLPFFAHWGIEMVYKQVHDAFPPVSREALATLQEACEEDAYLALLARLKPAFLHQKFAGHTVACRLLGSLPEFNRLKLSNWILPELEEWTKDGAFVAPFVQHIEESLFEAMTSYTPPAHVGDDLDRLSHRPKEVAHCVLAPLHPFGALARHKESFDFLRETEFLSGALAEVRNGRRTCLEADPRRLLRLKSSLWALGQLSASPWGLDWFLESEGLACLLDLACNAEVLSVRGHAFWCLGLVGSTSRGAEVLHHLGWSALRSDRQSKWPLQLPQPSSALGPLQSHTGHRQTRTESITSSCGSESRRSTFDHGVLAGNGDWSSTAWLGNGTTTVRSLGRSFADENYTIGCAVDRGSSTDIRSFATFNRTAVSASGSAHDLDGCMAHALVTSDLFNRESRTQHEGGSLSSLYNPASSVGHASAQRVHSFDVALADDSRRVKKHSSIVGVPIEYRGIALPVSCHALSTNLFSCTPLGREPASDIDEEEAFLDSSHSSSESTASVFEEDQRYRSRSEHPERPEANAAVSEESMSSACTSDYFSRTRSGSSGPLPLIAAPATSPPASEPPDEVECVVTAANSEASDDGLELHSSDLCLICSCGRGPSKAFNEAMAEPRRLVLERVVKLISHVHPRKHELALLALRERFPDLSQDFCLFTEVALLLASYRFNRAARTFLQEVFLELETASLYKLAQTVLPPLSEESDEC